MDASYMGWLALGVSCVSSACFGIWLRKWTRGVLEYSSGSVAVSAQSAKSENVFDEDTLLDLACSRLDESASCFDYLNAHPAISRSVFYPHRFELHKELESGAGINPHNVASLLQMHNQARYFSDESGDIPHWVAGNRWPTYEEQRDHLIDVVRRRRQRNLMVAVSDVQSEMPSPVKRKM